MMSTRYIWSLLHTKTFTPPKTQNVLRDASARGTKSQTLSPWLDVIKDEWSYIMHTHILYIHPLIWRTIILLRFKKTIVHIIWRIVRFEILQAYYYLYHIISHTGFWITDFKNILHEINYKIHYSRHTKEFADFHTQLFSHSLSLSLSPLSLSLCLSL